MKKEVRALHENVACDVCGRTILKGERTEPYLAPGGQRQQVCDLCFDRAAAFGWIREEVAGETPTRVPRPEPRRTFLSRLRRRRPNPGNGAAAVEGEPAEAARGETPAEDARQDAERADERAAEPPPQPRLRTRPKDPRHVRAVPTTAEVKVERALELFNGSHHQRTVAGLARTLGAPWVSAQPDLARPSAVNLVVAWELSWYRFRVDLGDEEDPVVMLEKGDELRQIDPSLRDWNGTMEADGRVAIETVASGGGEPG